MRDSKHIPHIQFSLRRLLAVTLLVAVLIAGYVAFQSWTSRRLIATTNSASIQSESDHYDVMDAAKFAGRFGDERHAMRALKVDFTEEDVDTRIMRINSLINFKSYGEMVSLLMEGLQDENATVRFCSAQILLQHGSAPDAKAVFREAAPHLNALIKAVYEHDDFASERAMDRAFSHAQTAARALKQIAPDFDPVSMVTFETHLAMYTETVRLECTDCPLREVVEFLSDYSGLKIEIESANIDLDSSLVTADESNLTMKSLFDLILPRVGASYRVEGDKIVIFGTAGDG